MTDDAQAQERTLRLTHPKLDFYVDVSLRPYEGGTWIATADMGDDHDVGIDKGLKRELKTPGLLPISAARREPPTWSKHQGLGRRP